MGIHILFPFLPTAYFLPDWPHIQQGFRRTDALTAPQPANCCHTGAKNWPGLCRQVVCTPLLARNHDT